MNADNQTTTNSTPSKFKRVDVSKTNFTTLYDGPKADGTDVIVDIVFVHGLGGGPEKTWSTSKLSAPPVDQGMPSSSMRRRLNRFWPKSRGEESAVNVEDNSTVRKHDTFWPADFLPAACPLARILTWGYDSKVTLFFSGPVDQGNYYSHAKDLLYDLNDLRGDRKRPIIWVTHSLGGIIVKQALLTAISGVGDNSSRSLKDIYESTRRILFLGTPHRGSSMVKWGIMAERLVKAAGFDTNDAILKQLMNQNPELGNLNEQFISLLKNEVFDVTTFKEASGMEGVYGLNGKVVEDFSSTIADEPQRTIPGNHNDMCKFSSVDDTGYRRIRAELCTAILQIQDMARNCASSQVGRVRSDPLREPLDILEQLMPDISIFGNHFNLYDAIEKGDEPTVRKLLVMGMKIDDEENLPFKSNLSLAISSGKIEIVSLLLDYGADIERRHPYSTETPLLEATKSRSHAIVKLLLQRGADTQSIDSKGNPPLHIACECGDEGIVDLLLHHEASMEQRCSKYMDTPLLLATRSGQSAIVDLLVQRGAFIEAADSERKTPLHLASELRDEGIARSLLRAGASPKAKESSRQRTPLHYAAETGNLAVARDLLQNKARPDTQDGDGTTALHLAAETGHTNIVSLLISKGATVNIPRHASRITPLHLASANGHDAVVKILIETGADAAAIQYPSLEGKTSLHLAAQNGHHLVVRLLCREGVIEKRESCDGNPPLLLAALAGHTLAVKALLDANAKIEAKNSQGSTALYLAIREGNEEVALLLLNEGAGTNWPSANVSAIQYAAFVGQISVVQKLLELGIDVQDVGKHGESALICAASAGHTAIVSLLLSNKAELDSKNSAGCTALQRASRNGHLDTARLLLKKGADFKLSDNIGRTALHDAATQGHEDVVRLLIGKGADCTVTDASFITPLHLAAMSGHDNLIPLLIEAGAIIDALASGQRTPLAFACQNGHGSATRALLKEGARVAGPEITPPLIAAAMGGHLEIIDILQSHRNVDCEIGDVEALLGAAYYGHALAIKKLLRWKGLDVNVTGPGAASALHLAATNGHDSAIRTLLEEGADVSQRSDLHWLPVHGAALNGHASIIRTLLNAGSDVDGLQDIFNDDLSSLRNSDREGLVRLFVQFARVTKQFYTFIKDGDMASLREQATNTAIVNMKDGNGNTALHAAIEYNCTEAIPILCDIGIEVDTKNCLERTALHDAVLRRNIKAQHILLQYGCDVNIPTYRGLTALHAAVMVEDEVSIKILVEAGADISIKSNWNQMNPLQYAEARGYEKAFPMLGK